jgi:hypothetical protein
VTDEAGNEATCTTVVTISSPISIAIPDVWVLPNGVTANTVYIGYAPAAVLSVKALATTTTLNAQPLSYQWSASGGIIIKPATANMETVQVMAAGSGSYSGLVKVVVTDNNGCSSEKTITIKVVDARCGDKVLVCKKSSHSICIAKSAVPAQLNKAGGMLGGCTNSTVGQRQLPNETIGDNDEAIVIGPNPTTSHFTLRLKNDLRARLIIRDVFGRIIEVKNGLDGAVNFGGSYLPGVYYAEVTRGNETVKLKLVKR